MVCAVSIVVLVVAALCGNPAYAQSDDSNDQSSWQKFVDSVGAAVYKFAWPTATYDHVSFQGISQATDGVDVKFRVHGISAFDNGPLWTDVILLIRNGQVDDIRWGANNAQLAAPGETMKALGSLLVQLNKDYNQDHPSTPQDQPQNKSSLMPPPEPDTSPAAVCMSNPTDQTIAYTLRSGGHSDDHSLAPGKEEIIWARVAPPEFTVSFDNSFEEGYTDRTMRLPAVVVAGEPATCSDDMTYEFVVDGRSIGLAPRKWMPGFEHPFFPSVLRAQKEGVWVCALGQKWVSGDPNVLECVPNDVGLLGLSINSEEGSQFPKIVQVAPGGAAEKAGVPNGAYLISVDGASLEGLSLNEVVAKMRGPVDSVARITISGGSADRPRVFELHRQ